MLNPSDVTPLLHGTHPATSSAGPMASAQFDAMRAQNGSAARDEPGIGDRAYSLDATYVVLV